MTEQGTLLRVRDALKDYEAHLDNCLHSDTSEYKEAKQALTDLDELIASVDRNVINTAIKNSDDIRANLRTHVEFNLATKLMNELSYLTTASKLLSEAVRGGHSDQPDTTYLNGGT